MGLERFVLDRLGIEALGRTTDMLRSMEDIANNVKSRAEGFAPVGSTGDYKASFEVESGVENGVATARVNNTDWKAGLIEFGTTTTPTFAPLRRAAESEGLSLQADSDYV